MVVAVLMWIIILHIKSYGKVSMLRLTRVTDYGILLMTELARLEHRTEKTRLTVSELTFSTRVPAPTISKILQSLLHVGMLACWIRCAERMVAIAWLVPQKAFLCVRSFIALKEKLP